MSCPHERELYETGALPLSHLERCADCREALRLLNRARDAASAVSAERDEIQLLRLWRATEARIEAQPKSSPWVPLGILAAAATVLALVLPREAPPPIEGALVLGQATSSGLPIPAGQELGPGTRAVIEPQARLRAGPARVVTGAQTEIEMGSPLEPNALFVRSGLIAVAVDPQETPYVVRTAGARLEILGGVFRLREGSRGTEVAVESGEAVVSDAEGGGRITVGAGHKHFIPASTEAASSAQLSRTEPAPVARAAPRERGQKTLPSAVKEALSEAVAPAGGFSPPIPGPDSPPSPAPQALAAVEAREPTPSETPPIPPTVARARAALGSDAKEARAIADAVIAASPPPKIYVEALMISGDAARRGGDVVAALSLFSRVADHPEAGAFGEEATLRAARIEHELGDATSAERRLSAARGRYRGGALSPEREALAAQILRERGRLVEAKRVVEGLAADVSSASLIEERLALAGALLEAGFPADARALVHDLDSPRLAEGVRAKARQIERAAQIK